VKQRAVEWARGVFRALPIPLARRRQMQDWVFTRFGSWFAHLPGYQLWLLQHPEVAIKMRPFEQLAPERAALLAGGSYPSSRPGILMVSHSLGGGTETHLRALAERLESEGYAVWGLRALGKERVRLLPWHTVEEDGLIYDREREFAELVEQLRALNIKHLHVHHWLDFGEGAPQWLQKLAAALGVSYDFTLHDYYAICPRYTLYDEGARGYCGEPDVRRCTGCVASFGSAAGREVDMPRWRTENAAFLNAARKVFAPDADVLTRMQRYVPEASLTLRPHWDATPVTPLTTPRRAGEPLRVLTLGAIAPHKGSRLLYECAADAKARGLPLEFTLIGFSDIDYKLKRVMQVTGKYEAAKLPQMIRDGGYQVAFFPALWPETFNYTLSETLHFGLYPVSLDIGAIARRIRALGYGAVLDYHLYRNPAAMNDALLALEMPEEVPVAKLRAAQYDYASMAGEYYGF
jgi:glycosyltransferase involved in cell wall biosynthesis